jgi:hypothetical protein
MNVTNPKVQLYLNCVTATVLDRNEVRGLGSFPYSIMPNEILNVLDNIVGYI